MLSNSADARHRRNARDFSRNGPLQPELLTTLLLYMVADANRSGYRHLLDAFWDEARSYGLELPTDKPVSAASFCNARPKITSALLRCMLNDLAATSFDDTFGSSQHWHGKRVFAVDGTKINLQRGSDLERVFGVPEGAYRPQALVSVLLDVCVKAPVDVEISGYASSEREHLLGMLHCLERGDVLVLDRGYPSHEVLQALAVDGIDFLVRVPSSHTFAVIDELRTGESDDRLFQLRPPDGAPPEWKPLTLRGVRIKCPDGSESFFLTSLLRSSFSRPQLRELYHMRWEAEEFYKLMKGPYIGQGQFRSKSPEGVKQELHALVLFLGIARVLMATAAKASGEDYESLSQKSAVLGLAAYITRLFLVSDADFATRELRALLRRIVRAREKRRRRKPSPRVSFKPGPRWGPTGRRGG